MESIHTGHRTRLRERFLAEGLSGFSEHEILELLLTYAIPQRDVNPLAHRLIDRFGSLAAVLDAGESELVEVEGIGRHAASLLTLMPPLMRSYQKSLLGDRPRITDFASARRYVQALFVGLHDEHVFMLCLDQAGHVLCPALLHRGTLDEVQLYPREVVELALRHHAHAVILTHNHPSGQIEPSQADYDVTQTLISALNVIGVRVVDHLIVSASSIYSMMRSSSFEQEINMSYLMRSSAVPGRARTLREADGLEFRALDFKKET